MQAQADQQHARFKAEDSDFLTWLNLWRYLKEQQRELSSSAFRRMCKREFLNYLRVREWQDFESQLRQVCKEIGPRPRAAARHAEGRARRTTPTASTRRCSSGLLSHIGLLDERDDKEQGRLGPAPDAGVPRRPRRAVRDLPRQRPGPEEPAVPDGRRARRDQPALGPAERRDQARVGRAARQGPGQADLLRAALVAQARRGDGPRAGHAVRRPAGRRPAGQLRQHRRAAGPRAVHPARPRLRRVAARRHRFHDREPARCSRRRRSSSTGPGGAASWSTSTRSSTSTTPASAPSASAARTSTRGGSGPGASSPTCSPSTRRCSPTTPPSEIREADYPQEWQSSLGEGLTFPISYHFEPGAAEDGLTIDVPVATLNRVAADDFSWNVPGLREELVTSLIRSLPKNLRVSFVPAPNKAREFLAAVPAGEEPLLDALERYFRSTTGVVVPREAWDWAKVPEHLRPTYRVVDDGGREQARGKDLEALKEPLRPHLRRGDGRGRRRQRASPRTGADRRGPSAPSRSPSPRGAPGTRSAASPAWSTRARPSGWAVFGSASRAGGPAPPRRAPAAAARRRPRRSRRCSARSTTPRSSGLAGSPYPSVAELLEDCRAAVVQAVVDAQPPARDEAAFEALRRAATQDAGGAPAGRARRRAPGARGLAAAPRSCSAGAPRWRCCRP